jgi:hypothetical protein
MVTRDKIELTCFILTMLYVIYIIKKAIKDNETQNTDTKS